MNKEKKMELELSEDKMPELKRTVGFWSMVFFGLVFMNPASALTYFGYTQVGSQGHAVISFILGSIVIGFTCLSYSKMVKEFPSAGSAYTYSSIGLGNKVGFLVGWAMILDYVLIPMFIFVISGLYFNRMYGIFPSVVWSVLCALVVWVINVVGLKVADIFNVVGAVMQVAFAAVFAILSGIYLTKHGISGESVNVLYHPGEFNINHIVSSSTLAILSFLGFDAISTISEESKISPQMIGRSMKLSVLIQAILLCGLVYVCANLFPDYTKIANPDTIGYDLYQLVGGTSFTIVVNSITTFLGLIGASTAVTAASRLLYSMGRDNVLPKKQFGSLNKKYNTPVFCITLIIIVSIIGGMLFDWSTIASVVSFGAIVGFICVNLSVILHFFIHKKEKKYLTNLILPICGVISLLYVLVNTSVICKIIGAIWMLCGVLYLFIGHSYSDEFRKAIELKERITFKK